MSLADELLADLEEANNDDLAAMIKEEADASDSDDPLVPADTTSTLAGIKNEDDDDDDEEPMEVDVHVSSVRELCKLRDSKQLAHILTEIDKYIDNPRKSNEMIGNVESDPEYQLIVEANSVAVEIDNEICKLYLILSLRVRFSVISHFQQSFTSSPRTNTRNAFPNWTL